MTPETTTRLDIDHFIVEWDGSRNWTLSERTVAERETRTKTGEILPVGREVIQFVGYYSTLEQALQSMLQNHINNSGADTARGIIAEIAEARRALTAAAKRITVVGVAKGRVAE